MPEPTPPPPLTALDSAGRGLRIRFVWRGDRFGHVIERVDGETATPMLASVESDAEVGWPDSPPVQQLSVESIDATTTALGVGAAAQSHWSISIQPKERHGAPALQFDVAARCGHGPRDFLGSRYQRMGDSVPGDSMAEALEFEPLSEIAATELDQSAGELVVRPVENDQKTVRWAYCVS